jgi:hypothetical protein
MSYESFWSSLCEAHRQEPSGDSSNFTEITRQAQHAHDAMLATHSDDAFIDLLVADNRTNGERDQTFLVFATISTIACVLRPFR